MPRTTKEYESEDCDDEEADVPTQLKSEIVDDDISILPAPEPTTKIIRRRRSVVFRRPLEARMKTKAETAARVEEDEAMSATPTTVASSETLRTADTQDKEKARERDKIKLQMEEIKLRQRLLELGDE